MHSHKCDHVKFELAHSQKMVAVKSPVGVATEKKDRATTKTSCWTRYYRKYKMHYLPAGSPLEAAETSVYLVTAVHDMKLLPLAL